MILACQLSPEKYRLEEKADYTISWSFVLCK
nr:MAG TPA: hypothetical protein [Caudoviricetes sp.]DAU99922.1 MAG TPA: hypothetical protein [Caudoviricetes sp.]